MIQRILHLIWIGVPPNYVKFSINNYTKINKGFDINFVQYTIQQLEQLYFEKKIKNKIDELAYSTIENIIHGIKYKNLVYRIQDFLNSFGNIPFIQIFSDIFRLALLNEYGGIYVDCDTFPIKPFDSNIMNMKNFCICDVIDGQQCLNNYFIGSNGEFLNDYFDQNVSKINSASNYMIKLRHDKPIDFRIRRTKFFKCKLNVSDFNKADFDNYYIEIGRAHV